MDRTTLDEAIGRYLDEVAIKRKRPDDARQKAKIWLVTPLAKKAISKVRALDLAKHRDARLAEGRTGNTVRLELGFLSHVFTVAIKEWGWPLENPVAKITMPKCSQGRERRLEGDEEARLLCACEVKGASKWLAPIVRFALATGMRRGEMLGLKWVNVDLNKKTVHLAAGATKTDRARTVPLSPEALAVLHAIPRSIDGRVFPLTPTGFGCIFNRAVKRSEIEGLTFHDLRHEATSRLFERGLEIQEVAAITGHQTLQMLKRYTHLRAEDLAEKLAERR